MGAAHGVEREWHTSETSKLSPGCPKFRVNGQQVDRDAYIAACETDPTLPGYRSEDDSPERDFPPEIIEAMSWRGEATGR